MLNAAWVMMRTLLYSLQLSTGSFPKPLTREEEQRYLALSAAGDLEARNILIEPHRAESAPYAGQRYGSPGTV